MGEEMNTEFQTFLENWGIESTKLGIGGDDIDADEAWELFLHLRDSARDSVQNSSSLWEDAPVVAEDDPFEEAVTPSVGEEKITAAEVYGVSFPQTLTSSSSGSLVVEPRRLSQEELIYKRFELALPKGLPKPRVLRIKEVFERATGAPSLLDLIPHLRERLPQNAERADFIKVNTANANFVMTMAEESGVVDSHVVNARLQVETVSGGLDSALEFYDEGFEKYGLVPNGYSDRLVLQMLVSNRRFSRALAFKEKVESQGRPVDLLAYGSLIEYCANRGQAGSAMMLLGECVAVHEGEKPGERQLSMLRKVFRNKLSDRIGELEALIGKDPLEWLRHGESELKREMSFSSRKNVRKGMDRMNQI